MDLRLFFETETETVGSRDRDIMMLGAALKNVMIYNGAIINYECN